MHSELLGIAFSFLTFFRLQVDLEVLDIHGGTSETDILDAFKRAELRAKKSVEGNQIEVASSKEGSGASLISTTVNNQFSNADSSTLSGGSGGASGGGFGRTFLFLDEMNACLHTALIEEAICHRTLHGRPISDGVQILAAANPYRRRRRKQHSDVDIGDGSVASVGGMVFSGSSSNNDNNTIVDDLVYNVHPMPRSLQEFVFDFGALSAKAERRYVRAMVEARFASKSKKEIRAASALISAAQNYVRQCEGDSSAVSLRDVKRCVDLVRFFIFVGANNLKANDRGDSKFQRNNKTALNSNQSMVSSDKRSKATSEVVAESPLSSPLVLALAHIYLFRLPLPHLRQGLWTCLRQALTEVRGAISVGGGIKNLPPDFVEVR